MQRALVVLALVLIGAAAGAYAQNSAGQESQPSSDVMQVGVLYAASFCIADPEWQYGSRPQYSFYMRPLRPLADGWIEAEVANRLTRKSTQSSEFVPEKTLRRINTRQLCELSVY